MATALPISQVRIRGPVTSRKTAVGWVGSKAGKRGDIIKIDSNGYIDQSVAAGSGAVVNPSGIQLGVLDNKIGSGVAAASAEALACSYLTGDNLELELQLITSTDYTTMTVPTATLIGQRIGLARAADESYVADATGSDTFDVTAINTVRNTVIGRIAPAYRLA